ncbi:hypothetical protein [Streptomyces sp. NPDC058683]|uniref:hypothetical protein n=1 Tax=Streptomyces sp. NPDC058683 TaxID=3346597 RepID=UPI00366430FF
MHPSEPSPAQPPSGTVSFRLGTLQLALPVLLGFLVGTALLYGGLAFTAQPMELRELGQCLTAAAVAGAVVPFLHRRHGVSLTEDALVVLGERSLRIPWADIRHLEVRRSWGVSHVAVHTADGRRRVLRAPISLLDGEFDRKARIIVERWHHS